MTNRTYRFILGALLLLALTLDMTTLMYGLIGVMLIEGITNWRIPTVVNRLVPAWRDMDMCAHAPTPYRFKIEAERVWRLLVGVLLVISYVLYFQTLWFFPWFMGFAILGAGASGICPMELTLKKIGFR